MMKICTEALECGQGRARIAWKVGEQRKGYVSVDGLDMYGSDAELIAEAAALQHLLFTKKVFDREPASGIGYQITVSKGAIKKAAKGKTSKKSLIPFTRYFTTRMKGVEIQVKHNNPQLRFDHSDDSEICKDSLNIMSVIDDENIDTIDTSNIGRLKITKHAYQQFIERLSTGDPRRPWLALVSRLQNDEIQLRVIPEKVLEHKARKYGDTTNMQVWGHPSSGMNYVVLSDRANQSKTLVTVFRR